MRLHLPESRPWQAPEYHHLSILFSEAQSMDIFSLGLPCLWLLYGATLEQGHAAVKSLWDAERDSVSFINADGNYEILEALKQQDLLGDFNPKNDYKGDADTPVQIRKSFLQLARADYRVRRGIVSNLSSFSKSCVCNICAANAAFEADVCHQLGFGVSPECSQGMKVQTQPLLSTSTTEAEVKNIREHVKYDEYNNVRMAQLDQAGQLTVMDYVHEYRESGRLIDVEVAYSKEIQDMQDMVGKNHIAIFYLRSVLISVIKGTGDTIRPIRLEEELLEEMSADRELGPDHNFTMLMAGNLAFSYRQAGRWDDAEESFKKLMNRYSSLLGNRHLRYLDSMTNLATTYREKGHLQKAEDLYLDVVRI